MVQGDYDRLVEMGFDAGRVTLAIKETKRIEDALTWLDQNQDIPLETLRTATEQAGSSSSAPEGGNDYDGDEKSEIPGTAASMKCSDCGKLFSSAERAQYHATRTEHQNFEESTEIIKPLTEEEKSSKATRTPRKASRKKKLRKLLKIARNRKKNELIRRKKGQDSDKIKEELRRKEQLKEVEKRKQEKIEDAAAKERVRQQIKETQELRRQQAEREKAAREGKIIEEQRPELTKPAAPKTIASHTETRLQLRLPSGPPLIKTFSVDTTLFEVAEAVREERGIEVSSITTTFPRKIYQQGIDFGQTLKEAGMVPSCALVVA